MTCPVCGAKTEAKWRPFCSKRCADLDLARWLGDGYRIPGSADETISPEDSAGDLPVPKRH